MGAIQFILIGLGIGAMYAIITQSLVLIYRGSGVLNFAQGGFVAVGAYAYYAAAVQWNAPPVLALAIAAATGAVAGVLVQLIVLRNMRRSSPILRVVATLAVLMLIQALAVLLYGGG